ncbi:MAG: hypothetical protein CVV02_16455 [Firmicutes bacterium HGW-Firmicutes-7]|nr:MAG: hypothetical protein CVV02_16455 [Firmicutes bacterium HGW-Firmicutes-7]
MKKYSYDYDMQTNPYASNISKDYPVADRKPTYEPEPPQMYIPQDMQRPMDEDVDYDDDDQADVQYMKSLYPDMCKRIQVLVDEECDKLEYDDSIMYDEYPDKEAIISIVGRIYVKMEKECAVPKMDVDIQSDEENVEAQQFGVPGRNIWLWDNVQVQLLNEMFGRRRRRFPRRYRFPYQPYRRPFRFYPRRIYLPYQPYRPYVPYNYRYFY